MISDSRDPTADHSRAIEWGSSNTQTIPRGVGAGAPRHRGALVPNDRDDTPAQPTPHQPVADRNNQSTPSFASSEALDVSRQTLGLGRSIEPPQTFDSSTVSLPKSGGAITPIAEKSQTNPVIGSLAVPLTLTPARGLEPQLALAYGSGNGPFGQGWSVGVSRIQRKTVKGLPTYNNHDDAKQPVQPQGEET